MSSWSITSLTSRQLTIKLEFIRPAEISQGGTPDILIVNVELSKFKAVDGQSLEESLMFKVFLPPQFGSQEEKEIITSAAGNTDMAMKTVFSSNFMINFFLVSAMGMLWGSFNIL